MLLSTNSKVCPLVLGVGVSIGRNSAPECKLRRWHPAPKHEFSSGRKFSAGCKLSSCSRSAIEHKLNSSLTRF